AGKALAGVMLLVSLLWYGNPYIFCGLLFGVKFFSDWSLSTSWGTVTDIGGNMSATVFAFNNAVAGAGALLAPILFGWIADEYGWLPVFVAVAVTYLLCGSIWLLINCTIPVVAEDLSGIEES
ncbi:MAG: hypothetical protein V3S56_05305, partial [Gemmatimonadota bacterium]